METIDVTSFARLRTTCALCILAILPGVHGCAWMGKKAFEDAYGRSMIGTSIGQVFPTHGQPDRIESTVRGTENYVYALHHLGKCTVYWEVADGNIVGMKYEGSDCVKGPFND